MLLLPVSMFLVCFSNPSQTQGSLVKISSDVTWRQHLTDDCKVKRARESFFAGMTPARSHSNFSGCGSDLADQAPTNSSQVSFLHNSQLRAAVSQFSPRHSRRIWKFPSQITVKYDHNTFSVPSREVRGDRARRCECERDCLRGKV